MAAVGQSHLEARLRATSEEPGCARGVQGERRRASGCRARDAARRWRRRLASLEAGTALAQAAGEKQAMSDELAQLRAEQRAMLTSHAEELAEARGVKAAEMASVEERLRGLAQKKDAAIGALQEEVGRLRAELHTARDQLHATQQEILAFQ